MNRRELQNADTDSGSRTCWLLALLSLAAATVLAAIVENLTTGGRLVAWDSELRTRFPAPKPSALTTFFQIVTWAGNAFVLAGLVAAAAVWFMLRKRPEGAALIVAGAFAAEATALTLKVTLHDLHPNSYAFPSGHTAGATATYGILLYLTVRRRSLALHSVAALALVSLISVVAMSRLYLHVHYLSDVIAGSTLGVAVAAVSLCLYEWRERRASNRQGTALI